MLGYTREYGAKAVVEIPADGVGCDLDEVRRFVAKQIGPLFDAIKLVKPIARAEQSIQSAALGCRNCAGPRQQPIHADSERPEYP